MKVQSYLKSVSSNAHIMQPAYSECDTIEQSDKRWERMKKLKEKSWQTKKDKSSRVQIKKNIFVY